ncbi:MAG TPA: hypothetical protein V6C69_15030 [Trichormus sp.]|jgi:hypothetical protein
MKSLYAPIIALLALINFVPATLADSEAQMSGGSEATTQSSSSASSQHASQAKTESSSQAQRQSSTEASHHSPGPKVVNYRSRRQPVANIKRININKKTTQKHS